MIFCCMPSHTLVLYTFLTLCLHFIKYSFEIVYSVPSEYSIIYAYLMHLDILKPAYRFRLVASIKGTTVINSFI